MGGEWLAKSQHMKRFFLNELKQKFGGKEFHRVNYLLKTF